MDFQFYILILVGSYFIGSINGAILICKLFRLPSPRSVGSGNPGTTNVLRMGKKFPAFLTLVFDISKGLIPVLVAKLLGFDDLILSLIALFAILGHMYPIWFGFQGGKGVATFIGVLIAFNPYLAVIFIAIWLLVSFIFRYSSLSALTAALVIPFIINIYEPIVSIAFFVMIFLIFARHGDNIRRLLSGEESKIKLFKRKKNKTSNNKSNIIKNKTN